MTRKPGGKGVERPAFDPGASGADRTTERNFRRLANSLVRDRLRQAADDDHPSDDATMIDPPQFGDDPLDIGAPGHETIETDEPLVVPKPPEHLAIPATPDVGIEPTPFAPTVAPAADPGAASTMAAPAPDPGVAPTVAAPGPAPATRPQPVRVAAPLEAANVVVMFGCRGGSGATTLAVNCAATLARAGKRVCVLDLDLQLGDVFVSLNLEATTSIVQLSREATTLEDTAFLRRLASHSSGLQALSQVGNVSEIEPDLAQRVPALLARLSSLFDCVIIDGPRDFDDFALAALDAAGQIAVVVTQDVPAMRRAARALSIMRQVGYPERKITLVVNRHGDERALMDDGAIEKALRLPIAARVRNDHRTIRSAIDRGLLLEDVAPRAAVTGDVTALASLLAGEDLGSMVEAPRPGLFARLFGKG